MNLSLLEIDLSVPTLRHMLHDAEHTLEQALHHEVPSEDGEPEHVQHLRSLVEQLEGALTAQDAPVRPEHPVVPQAVSSQESLSMGLRQAWVDGTGGPKPARRFDVTCGAGLGSPWIIFTFRDDGDESDGGDRTYRLHVGALLDAALHEDSRARLGGE